MAVMMGWGVLEIYIGRGLGWWVRRVFNAFWALAMIPSRIPPSKGAGGGHDE